MQDRIRWTLAFILFTLGAIFFDLGWTLPFASLGWLSLPLVDIAFSFMAACFIVMALLLVWKSWAK